MASNIAARRGRKAAHRKQVLAERRKADATHKPSLDETIAHALKAPFYTCMMPEKVDEIGAGTIVVARSFGAVITSAYFLVDTFALGVKDTYIRLQEDEEHRDFIDHMNAFAPMVETEPARVRRFLHDLVAWARGIGFEPHGNYHVIERIFGDVDPAGDATFSFGENGRPVYIAGPSETLAQIDQRRKVIAKYEERMGLPPPANDDEAG